MIAERRAVEELREVAYVLRMQSTPIALTALTLSLLTAGASHAHMAPAAARDLQLDLASAYANAGQAAADPAPSAPAPESIEAPAVRWGEKGCVTVNLSAGYADDFEEISAVPATVGVSWFLIRNLSFDLQLEGSYVSQPGDDAVGGGIAMMVRWHFLDFETWTIYADVGVGCMAMSEPVPSNAADFLFTPRAGVGASFALNDRTRLMTGLRWYHMSNAETSFENPGVDTVQGYVGLSFAF